jgi:hypothetical protein
MFGVLSTLEYITHLANQFSSPSESKALCCIFPLACSLPQVFDTKNIHHSDIPLVCSCCCKQMLHLFASFVWQGYLVFTVANLYHDQISSGAPQSSPIEWQNNLLRDVEKWFACQ